MSSIWDISLEFANRMYLWASIAAIVLAILAAVSTFLIFWASGVRDKHADQTIENARATASKAHERAATANSAAASANERAQAISQENLQLAIKLEEERKARLIIEKRLEPRRLDQGEQSALIERLSAIKPFRYCIGSVLGDEEGQAYANELITCFEKAGHLFDETGAAQSIFTGPVYGLMASIREYPSEVFDRVAHSLADVGLIKLPLQYIKDSSLPVDRIQITVGHKPED